MTRATASGAGGIDRAVVARLGEVDRAPGVGQAGDRGGPEGAEAVEDLGRADRDAVGDSATWQQSIDTFVKVFHRCINDGSAPPGDPLAYAQALMAILHSQLAHWVVQGMPADRDRVVDDVTTLVLHAFAAPATLRRHRARPACRPPAP